MTPKQGARYLKRKAALGVAEYGEGRRKKKVGTQIDSFSKRHNSNRSSTGLKEALWGVRENNNDLKEEGERNEWTPALKLQFVQIQ